jgi:tol-pal system protein YbgF
VTVIRRLLVIVAILGLAAPARAANKDMERLYIQIAALQTQIADLQRTGEESLKEIRRLNESLAEQLAASRKGDSERRIQDENVQSSLKELGERLGQLNERLEGLRLAAAPSAAAPGANPALPAGPGSPPVANAPANTSPTVPPAGPAPPPRELYSQAYADYARGNFDLAIQEYQDYLRNYPATDFSDNAQYWIGECLYSKQKFPEAIEAWDELLRAFPSSDKLPDARLKRGMALERLGRRREALAEFRTVAERFPNTEAARKARERLGPQ